MVPSGAKHAKASMLIFLIFSFLIFNFKHQSELSGPANAEGFDFILTQRTSVIDCHVYNCR